MMLQAFTTLMFGLTAILAIGVIAMMLSENWEAMMSAFGRAPADPAPAPLPPRYRALPARRATMTVMDAPAFRVAA